MTVCRGAAHIFVHCNTHVFTQIALGFAIPTAIAAAAALAQWKGWL